MKERPIIFSGPMVRAILAGRKTQTRRIVKLNASGRVQAAGGYYNWHPDDPNAVAGCRLGVRGDRLWVRETWQPHPDAGLDFVSVKVPGDAVCYAADMTDAERKESGPWVPSIYMPREACRILLEVTEVRAQRLQEISGNDAIAEGVADTVAFRRLWSDINGEESWATNPLVWAITFRRVQ